MFPKSLKSAFGGKVSENDFIICGGKSEDIVTDSCYHLDLLKNDNFIKLSHSLLNPRAEGIAVPIEGLGLWIIGGIISANTPVDTSEIVSLTETKQGPDLPDIWTASCAVKISDNSIFIGGKR